MGSASFIVKASGATAREAFQNATSDARHEYGNRGYTGSIAEKHSFQMLTLPADKTAVEFANEIVWDDDHWVSDKSGPAGCIALGGEDFLFVGQARC